MSQVPRPRARLDHDRILDAAERVAASEGIDKLTMRRLGQELDADPTAIYRHFRDKDELLFAVADRLFGEGPELDLSKGWREAVREQIQYSLDRYRVHPDLAQLLALQPDTTANLTRIIDRALQAFEAAGLTPAQAAAMYHVLENHVVGTGLFYALLENAGMSDRSASRRAFAALSPVEHPHAVAAAAHLFPEADRTFALTTEMILDAVERLARESDRLTGPSPAAAGRRRTA